MGEFEGFPPIKRRWLAGFGGFVFEGEGWKSQTKEMEESLWGVVASGSGVLKNGMRTETEELAEEEPACSARAFAACTAYPSASTYIVPRENMGITTSSDQIYALRRVGCVTASTDG